jgi:hypothetical protein
MTTATTAPDDQGKAMPRPRPHAPDPGSQAGVRPWLVVAAIALCVALAAMVWLLWPREDKLGAVIQMQKRLLESGGKPSRATIDQLIRTVDRLDRRDIGSAYRAAGAEWTQLKQEAIDAYFQAAAADRPRLLDEHIARMTAYHDLLVALNPGARPDSPAYLPRDRRRRDPKAEPDKPPADAEAEAARRQLAERFDAAVEAHAKSRGQPLPVFR